MARRWYLSKREARKLREHIRMLYPDIPLEFNRVEKVVDKSIGEIIVVDGTPSFIVIDGRYYPLLTLLLEKGYTWMPYVVVDKGAVKPLLRGADVMAPGIREVHGVFKEGDPVVVVEEVMRKPFVVTRALVGSDSLTGGAVKRGRVLENLHRVGDSIWKYVRENL